MTELKWRDSYEIGVNFIDEDHKNLLSIITSINIEIDTGDYSGCAALLDKFISETKSHFSKEEAFLHKINYPGLRQHINYHKELLKKVKETKNNLEKLETKEDIKKCFNGMARFVFDDILQGDINFKSYLEHEGYTDS